MATVITNLFSVIPVYGSQIVTWLWGAFNVGNATLNRFFSLHYLLPFAIAGATLAHLAYIHKDGSNNPLGINGNIDKIPFYPYFYIKDLYSVILFVIFFSLFVFFAPNLLNHPDNYIEANPLVTPAHIVPEWYFLRAPLCYLFVWWINRSSGFSGMPRAVPARGRLNHKSPNLSDEEISREVQHVGKGKNEINTNTLYRDKSTMRYRNQSSGKIYHPSQQIRWILACLLLGYAGKTYPKPDSKPLCDLRSQTIERYGELAATTSQPEGDNRFRNVGLPKGGNSYGNGAFVVCATSPALVVSRLGGYTKGKQRFFSTKANAVGLKPDGISSLEELRSQRLAATQHVYKILTDENIYIAAYEQIKSKLSYRIYPRHAQNRKMSGICYPMAEPNKEKLQALAEELRTEKYQCQPIYSRRREQIQSTKIWAGSDLAKLTRNRPNKNITPRHSESQFFSIATIKDKLVQTVMMWIIEAVYKEELQNTRAQHHTGIEVLKQIQQWKGCSYVIVGHIKNCPAQIDPHKLANILSQRIKDQQFIDLYWKIVKAGYWYENEEEPNKKDTLLDLALFLEESKKLCHTQQKNTLASVLTEISFHELDKFIEKLIKEINPQLRWARYANHWIIGVPWMVSIKDGHHHCEQIKEKIKEFLKEQLGLDSKPEREMSGHNTDVVDIKITYIRKKQAQFLGVQIGCSESRKALQVQKGTKKKAKNGIRLAGASHLPFQEKLSQSITTERVGPTYLCLKISRKKIINKLIQAGFLRKKNKKYYIQAISKWISLDPKDILYKYNTIIKSFFVACTFIRKTLFREVVGYILKHSCAKVFSRKFRLTSRKGAFQKFGKNLGTSWSLPRSAVEPSKFAKFVCLPEKSAAHIKDAGKFRKLGGRTD